MRLFTLAATTALVLAMAIGAADARERSHSGSFQGSHGRTASVDRDVNRERGSVARDTSVTGENGRTANRNVQNTWDRETGTGTHSSTSTGPNGNTRSSEGNVNKNEDGSYTYSGSTTGKNGNTATLEGTASKNEDESWSTNSTTTGANGTTLTRSGTTQRTDNGVETTGTYETSKGQSGTYDTTTTYENGVLTRSHSRTNQDGETRTRIGSIIRDRMTDHNGTAAGSAQGE